MRFCITFVRIRCSPISSVKQQNSSFHPTNFLFPLALCVYHKKFPFFIFHLICSKLVEIYSLHLNFSRFWERDGIMIPFLTRDGKLLIPRRDGIVVAFPLGIGIAIFPSPSKTSRRFCSFILWNLNCPIRHVNYMQFFSSFKFTTSDTSLLKVRVFAISIDTFRLLCKFSSASAFKSWQWHKSWNTEEN